MNNSERVAGYYDRNTSRFLRFGGAGETAAIHRKIWAPGVRNRTQAFEYLNTVVAREAAPEAGVNGRARLLDLGCGVGGTASWLVERLDVSVVGVSNSPVQIDLANARARRRGLEQRCQFLLADFVDLPKMGQFHGAYAIESFIHASDPARFFSNVAGQLTPGGRLVICDDFLSESALALPADAPAWRMLHRFTAGWQASNLDAARCAKDLAQTCGLRLVNVRNLTPYLRHFHPLVLSLLYNITWLPVKWVYWQNLSGGSALQICTQRGWIQYLVLVFEKEE